MLDVPRRVVATVLALALFGGATAAAASAGEGLYRTDGQAAHYLTHRLRRWDGLDLRKFTETAYCVGAGRGHVSRDGVPVYRSFSCVLNVTVARGKNGTRVFQLDLAKERHGWRNTPDGG